MTADVVMRGKVVGTGGRGPLLAVGDTRYRIKLYPGERWLWGIGAMPPAMTLHKTHGNYWRIVEIHGEA